MKKTIQENFRVVVFPERPFLMTDDTEYRSWYRACEEIKKDIEHHIDGFCEVSIAHDTKEICSFCGNTWETDDLGCPVCCQKAVEEWEKSKDPK